METKYLTSCKSCRRLGGGHYEGCSKVKPLFTTKHYKELAKLVNKEDDWFHKDLIKVHELIQLLKKDNPKFSYLKFRKEVSK